MGPEREERIVSSLEPVLQRSGGARASSLESRAFSLFSAEPQASRLKPQASSLALRLDQPLADRVADEIDAVVDVELVHDRALVRVHRLRAPVEHPRDVGPRHPPPDQPQHLLLAAREPGEPRRPRLLRARAARDPAPLLDLGAERELALRGLPDRLDEALRLVALREVAP